MFSLLFAGAMVFSSPAFATCRMDIEGDPGRIDRLTKIFVRSWTHLGGRDATAVAREVIARYEEPHRAYHDLRHLDETLAHVDLYFADDPELTVDRDVLTIALFFKNAVLKAVRIAHNQSASAFVFMHHSAGMPSARAHEVESLILSLTNLGKAPAASTEIERAFIDLEHVILGAEAMRFTEAELARRLEYPNVTTAFYREQRTTELTELALRESLYLTSYFRHLFERRAKANIRLLNGGRAKR